MDYSKGARIEFMTAYVGRMAPSPTGYLHLGHARTFWVAHQRARRAGGGILLRCDDLDPGRCRPEFVSAMEEDLRWLGLDWDGPVVFQSARGALYRAAFELLKQKGFVYPCWCTRRDIEAAGGAPHEGGEGDEPVYPGTCRPERRAAAGSGTPCWRFRVPDGEEVRFEDGRLGNQGAFAGVRFGDFVAWRKDDQPSYQLACAVDDTDPALGVTEVVRGEDLVLSTFRQLLLIRALGRAAPAYYHCALVTDTDGKRLAKRHDALSLRALRATGVRPEAIIQSFRSAVEATPSSPFFP